MGSKELLIGLAWGTAATLGVAAIISFLIACQVGVENADVMRVLAFASPAGLVVGAMAYAATRSKRKRPLAN